MVAAALAAVAVVVAVPIVSRTGAPPEEPVSAAASAAPSASASAAPLDDASTQPPPPVAPATTPSAAVPAVAAAEAVAAFGRWWLGAAVFDRDTGEIVAGARGAEPDYTASLSKLLVVIDVLEQRRAGTVVLTEADANAIRQALGPSSDGAMNYLWGRYDGLGAIGRMSALLGLTTTTRPRDPAQWAEMMSSAVDVARMWRHVLLGLPDADREFVMSAAAASRVRATDGFDQQFGLFDDSIPAAAVGGAGNDTVGDAAGAGAVAKQGWMCCFRNQFTLHSAGLPYPSSRYVIVLLTRQSMAGGWDGASDRVGAAALAAVQATAAVSAAPVR